MQMMQGSKILDQRWKMSEVDSLPNTQGSDHGGLGRDLYASLYRYNFSYTRAVFGD
jgi:hypothetical protein